MRLGLRQLPKPLLEPLIVVVALKLARRLLELVDLGVLLVSHNTLLSRLDCVTR